LGAYVLMLASATFLLATIFGSTLN